ncbi:MAG: DNA repair protein [Crocosphaera sp.]|nr:DNA repair protein [Crocosphaera sp.]
MINQHQQNVLTILLMRFSVRPSEGIKMGEQWLNEHPQSNWATIVRLLKNNELTIVERSLKFISKPSKPNKSKILRKYRGVEMPAKPTPTIKEQSSEKKRRYRGVEY